MDGSGCGCWWGGQFPLNCAVPEVSYVDSNSCSCQRICTPICTTGRSFINQVRNLPNDECPMTSRGSGVGKKVCEGCCSGGHEMKCTIPYDSTRSGRFATTSSLALLYEVLFQIISRIHFFFMSSVLRYGVRVSMGTSITHAVRN